MPNPRLLLRAALSQGIGFVSSASGKGLRDSLIEAAARGEGSFLLEHYGHQLNGVRFRLREILLRLLLDLFFLSEENHLKFFTDFPERVEDYLLSSSVAFERDVLENQRAYFGDIGKRHLKSRQTSDGRSRASQLRARMWKKLWKFSFGAMDYRTRQLVSDRLFIAFEEPRDRSSVGRAPASHAGGHRFETGRSHFG